VRVDCPVSSVVALRVSDVPLFKRLAAEFLGTTLLLTIVTGSGIMAQRLCGGNAAIALLANAIATGAGLVALIFMFGELSTSFNPVVTLVDVLSGHRTWPHLGIYAAAQLAGAVIGVLLAHAMFDLSMISLSTHHRSGFGQVLAEVVATFGLIITIVGCRRNAPAMVPFAVASYITAAYWFTSSTSFANPAVTIARCLSDTFVGIHPGDVLPFIAAQLVGGVVAFYVSRWLFADIKPA
jgi:glycerol uptake facilitator-like aquaporin